MRFSKRKIKVWFKCSLLQPEQSYKMAIEKRSENYSS
jgi:hypothetical protein